MTSNPTATLEPQLSRSGPCSRPPSSPAAPAASARRSAAASPRKATPSSSPTSTRRQRTGRPQRLPDVGWAEHRGFAGNLAEGDANRELAAFAAKPGRSGWWSTPSASPPSATAARSASSSSATKNGTTSWRSTPARAVLPYPRGLPAHAHGRQREHREPALHHLQAGTGGGPDADFAPFLPSSVAYGASKAALQNLTASLAHELADLKIRVNGVAPGFVQTPMMGKRPRRTPNSSNQVPMKRFARPEEIADAVAFLVGRPVHLHHRHQPGRQRRLAYLLNSGAASATESSHQGAQEPDDSK